MGESGSNPNPEKVPSSVSRSLSEEDKSRNLTHHVLIVDDNESDVYLIQKALEGTNLPLTFDVVKDGEQAVRFFERAEADPGVPCPELVLLDINLPKRTGYDVLKRMRGSKRCATAHVIVVSTSDSPRDREQMAEMGADGYFRKPSAFDEFMKLGDLIRGVLGGRPQ